MPHLILECSAGMLSAEQKQSTLKAGHNTMLQSGLFEASAVKSRLHETSIFRVGDGDDSVGFLHARIHLMEGRSLEQKQALTQAMLDALSPYIAENNSLTVDISDMARTTYRKR